MGVNLKNLKLGEVQPQCNDCGVGLCWSIDEIEYYEWKGFWDNWTCEKCNPNYKGAFYRYQQEHKPFEWLPPEIKKEIMEKIINSKSKQ